MEKLPENNCPWTEEETTCLISLWGDGSVQAKLEEMYRNKTVFEGISRTMRERGFRRSWLQCQRKIKGLKAKYKEIKDNGIISGAGRHSFPFYDALDAILGDRPSVRPPCCGTSMEEHTENNCPWTKEETTLLISLWGDRSVQAELGDMYQNKTVFEIISCTLRERGFRRSWLQCQRKIKALKAKYYEIKDNKSGAGRHSFPFYDALDTILGDRPSVRPLLVLASSAPVGKIKEEEDSGNTDEQTHDSADASMCRAISPSPALCGSGTSACLTTDSESPSITRRSENSSETTSEHVTVTKRKRKNKMDAALDVFAKKMGEVLEKDNQVLLQMQAAQHKHEMAMMTFLAQLIKDGQSQRCPPVPPSFHSSVPPGASQQPSEFQPVLTPHQQGSRSQQHTDLQSMPRSTHTQPQTTFLQDVLIDQHTVTHNGQT